MIEFTIDDKKISVLKGTTILRAAKANGIYIPNLCYDRRLRPYGGCRLCLVEVEGQKKLLAACSTPAGNGMVVHTNTPNLQKARKTVLELLLIHHPLDCPVCDKAGECKLQDLAYEYGPSASRFLGERKHDKELTGNPLIVRNPNRCILCGKCVRVCWEHQGVGAINFIGRGFKTKISPAFEETLNCEFCGQCIDACPVGALGSKPYSHRSRAWFLENRDNICPYCAVGCTVTYGLQEEKILRARGIDEKGVNKGDLCGKGRFGFDFIYSENRLRTPLIRENGKLRKATWEETLYLVSQRLSQIKDTKGSESIGAVGSSRCTIEDNYMLQKFMRNVLGTNNIDSSARLGYAKVAKGIEMSFGLKSNTIKLGLPLEKDVILVVESDITATHPIWGLQFLEAKRNGSNLIIAEPRETKLARHAGTWMRMKPGTSVALLNGIAKMAIDQGLVFNSETTMSTEGFDMLQETLKEYTPDKVSEITGINRDIFVTTALEFLRAENRMIAMTVTNAENAKGLNSVLAAANLVMLTGDGPSALQIPGDFSNTHGMWLMGISPSHLPGMKTPEGAEGKNIADMLYNPGNVNALYIMGEDPIVTFPDSTKIEETLKSLDFLVVQDIRLTETAKLADVVLPAASWAEKEGTFINGEGLPQPVRKMVPATGDSIPDWQIFRNLSRVMQADMGTSDLNSIQNEILRIETDEGNKKWKFHPVKQAFGEVPDDKYPISLITGNVMQHSGELSVMSKSLSHVLSDAFIQINPADAEKSSIHDGGFVKITSQRGEVFIKARVSEEVPEGMLFVPVHFPHARVNSLTYISTNGSNSITAVKIEAEN
ncbi:putative formate dehydrogenase [bacterium BMS3Abin07]|nr:putative formate dehydrogenase [bacterium BMS3Abin07]GBE32694.1 putative formate dehydrogenase [bacterium BMS3Bbin05]HDL21296.1 NADH dehydrogenase (quinone) subunit G [Nitrospirota bacterium]HDO22087.1 NADH dehydrogenase (quinone) subunit G [Nitrospirota bacterium]HDZ88397.1 NADH dehydrogenase (quinone) subunit G [Nitrospirota bacterium]